MKKRVLITGGTGLLGLNWALSIRDKYAVTLGMHHRDVILAGVDKQPMDLGSVVAIDKSLTIIQPDLVIHAGALTNIEACEANQEQAQYTNVMLAKNVAVACARLNIPLVHISSDHLFSGRESLVEEIHPLAPQNVYAQTKVDAEVEVLQHHPNALIIRTNFYGWGPSYRSSFSDIIINNLRSGHLLQLFQDVFYTPIVMSELVRTVHDLVDKKVNGIFHVVGDERISKYHFGLKIAEHFQLDNSLIKASHISDNSNLVKRPRDMSLSNKKACTVLGRLLGGVDEHLRCLREQEFIGFAQELKNCCI